MNRAERRRRARPLLYASIVMVVGLIVACGTKNAALQAEMSGVSALVTVALLTSTWWASDERGRQHLVNLGALVLLGTLAAHGGFRLAAAFGYQGEPESGAAMLLAMLVVMLGDTALGMRERQLDRASARHDSGRPA